MNNSYKKYIENRLKVGGKVSSQHLCAITAVDYYGAEKEFYLLQFYNTECLLLKCVTNDSNQIKRVGIVSCSKFQHGLNTIYKSDIGKDLIDKYEEAYFMQADGVCQYDSYYNKLSTALNEYKSRIAVALNEIQMETNMSVYVCYNKYYSTKAVVYALQEKVTRVVLMHEVKENLDIIEIKRVLHLLDFNKMHLNTYPFMSVADCFSPQSMYIPMSEVTLDSEFCNGKKWRDLIANVEIPESCTINGVSCSCVTIKMAIDIFNNVFCTIQSLNGEKKTILLHNALEVNLEQENMSHFISSKSDPQVIKAEDKEAKDIEDHQIDGLLEENTMITQSEEQNTNNMVDEETLITKDSSDCTTISVEIPNSRDNIKKVINPTEKKFTLEEGSTYTYLDLFGDYLVGAEEIKIEDGYIYKRHQINNIGSLIQTAITVNLDNSNPKCLKKVILITKEASVCIREKKKELEKYSSPEEANEYQIKEFTRLKKQFKEEGIEFSYTIKNKVHDREMTLSNGWTITLGRGLDIFNKPITQWSPKTCKYTKIVVSRTDKMVTLQKKKKNIKIL